MSEQKIQQPGEGAGNKNMTLIAAGVAIVAVIAVVLFLAMGNGAADSKNSNSTAEGQAIAEGNPVVAKVNGEDIYRDDVFGFISGLPQQYRQLPLENLFPMSLDQVISNRVIAAQAAGANLDRDPEVREQLEEAKKQIVRSVFIDRAVDAAITDELLRDTYESVVAGTTPQTEISARHILVESESKAKELIRQLDEGADFVALVREHSVGPSADQGGDLGFFVREEMIPEFSDAAFEIAVGSYSTEPVETQFGWHVIKVEASREREVPGFEEVKEQLRPQLRQQVLDDLVAEWRDGYKIEIFDINGNPLEN